VGSYSGELRGAMKLCAKMLYSGFALRPIADARSFGGREADGWMHCFEIQ
jgi:hypothetical protein